MMFVSNSILSKLTLTCLVIQNNIFILSVANKWGFVVQINKNK